MREIEETSNLSKVNLIRSFKIGKLKEDIEMGGITNLKYINYHNEQKEEQVLTKYITMKKL